MKGCLRRAVPGIGVIGVSLLGLSLTLACAGTESGNPSLDPILPMAGNEKGTEQGAAGSPNVATTPVDSNAPGSANECTNGWGSCKHTPAGNMECTCSYYQATRSSTQALCTDALASCRPEAAICQDFTGFCDPAADGWSCRCVGAAPVLVSANGAPSCAAALKTTCSNAAVPAGNVCSAEKLVLGVPRSGRCIRDFDGQTPVFRCTCSAAGKSAGAVLTLPASQSCAANLEDACFAQ